MLTLAVSPLLPSFLRSPKKREKMNSFFVQPAWQRRAPTRRSVCARLARGTLRHCDLKDIVRAKKRTRSFVRCENWTLFARLRSIRPGGSPRWYLFEKLIILVATCEIPRTVFSRPPTVNLHCDGVFRKFFSAAEDDAKLRHSSGERVAWKIIAEVHRGNLSTFFLSPFPRARDYVLHSPRPEVIAQRPERRRG